MHPKIIDPFYGKNNEQGLKRIISKQISKPDIFKTKAISIQKNHSDDKQQIKFMLIQV